MPPLAVTEGLLKRIDGVLAKANAAVASDHMSPSSGTHSVDREKAQQFRSSGLALIGDMFGAQHHLFTDFVSKADGYHIGGYKQARAIITTVRELVESGWLASTRSLIAAEVFGDFMEMADYLLQEEHPLPAAVVAGASLESHLRRLCGLQTPPIPTEAPDAKGDMKPKRADTLNQELAKAQVYEKGDVKDVVSWLDTRNEAAHGHIEKVIPGKVDLMIQGIRLFMKRFPA